MVKTLTGLCRSRSSTPHENGERGTPNVSPPCRTGLVLSTNDTPTCEPADSGCSDIEPDPSRGENQEEQMGEKEVEADDKEPAGGSEKENTPVVLSTKKQSQSPTGDKLQVQRRKRGRFSSPLPSDEETETGDESDISSYRPSRAHHTSNARPTSSRSTSLERDTSDSGKMAFPGGRSRTVVIYEQQSWQGEIIKEKNMKQGRGRPRKQYLIEWKPSWVDGGRLTAPGLVECWKVKKASKRRFGSWGWSWDRRWDGGGFAAWMLS